MFEVTLKCLNSHSPAVNWTKIMNQEEVLNTLAEMRLRDNEMDWESETKYVFSEFASAYHLIIKPVNK